MNIFKKIADATGDSLEAVYQMQEEERSNLIIVLGIQQETEGTKARDQKEESGEPSKGGRKRKALQTFLSENENPNKKLNRDTTEGEVGVSLKSNTRAAARKANLKVSEINRILDSGNDPEASNDPDQKIEDFDDFDIVGNDATDGKVDNEVITVVPQNVSKKEASDRDSTEILLNLRLKCPDLLKFVRKKEDLLKEDLPELNLNEERRPKFEKGERKGERHRRAVKCLTSNGLIQNKITRKSWVKIKIVKNKPKTLHVTKDGTLGGRESEEDDEAGLFNGIKDDRKKLNIQKENKNLFDNESEDEQISKGTNHWRSLSFSFGSLHWHLRDKSSQ